MNQRAIAVVMLASGVAMASPRNPAQETAIDEELSAVDASLVSAAHEANAAADRGDMEAAARAYAKVHEKAPRVVAITRRLCTAEARSGKIEEGLAHCRQALRQDSSAENQAALAVALLMRTPAVAADANEAFEHAAAAVEQAPDAEFAQSTLCEAAIAVKSATSALDRCSEKLRAIAPTSPTTHLYLAMARAAHEDWDGAARELDTAHAAGYSDAGYRAMRFQIDQQREKRESPFNIAFIVLSSWIGLLFVVFVVGMMSSDATSRSPRSASAVYRLLLRVAALSFWPSAVMSAFLFLFVVFEIVWRFLVLAGATKWVLAAVGAAALYVAIATVRALFARVDDPDLGARVDLAEEPALRDALDGLDFDEVWIAPSASIEAVRRGRARALVIGAGTLTGLSPRGLAAIATCELARIGDPYVMERAALDALCDRMEARGLATRANPAWWFARLYRAFYARISEGALDVADARAEKTVKSRYGASTLAEALEHVDERAEKLAERTASMIVGALDGDEKEANPFEHEEKKDEPDSWSLFSDRAAIEREMNERLRARLRDRAGIGVDQASSASSVARA